MFETTFFLFRGDGRSVGAGAENNAEQGEGVSESPAHMEAVE